MLLLGSRARAAAAYAQERANSFGVLVDTTLCVGCRSCEQACNEVNTDLPRKTLGAFQRSIDTGREAANGLRHLHGGEPLL